jgi:general secretion pathway protein C
MGLDARAKHYAPWIICLLLGIAAYFQAAGISQLLVAAAISSGDLAPRAASVDKPLPLRRSDRDLSAAAILERNPFDSVTGPLMAYEASPPRRDQAASSADPFDDPPCDIARAVLIASADDPAWSFAVITGPDGKNVLRRGGEEFYGGTVNFIGDLRVWLTGPSGVRCQLKLGAKPPVAMPPPGPPPGGPKGPPSPLAGRIRQISAHEFDVDRSAVDALLANPGDLMKTRVVPEKEGDRIVGLKLFGIRPNTVLSTLGLENGDRLVSINGFEMNDPQKMLEAYGKLTRADRISAAVVRNGKPMTIDFNIK